MAMESIWNLAYLLEPASITLILTAIVVTFVSAFRALNHGKEMERNHDFQDTIITLDCSQAILIPILSSCSLIFMFYMFSSLSQFLTALTCVASVFCLYFCLSPLVTFFNTKLGLVDPFVSNFFSKSFTRNQVILLFVCVGIVMGWLVSGHWMLNNLLGISICIAFVSHVRFPNIKTCAILLFCLFLYDVFWVYFSEMFFGTNVMVSVATHQASNPVHIMANSLSLPGLQMITKKLELPVKIVFPRNLMGGNAPGSDAVDFMMLGLGDMAIPAMLLAFVLCYDYRRSRDSMSSLVFPSLRGQKYIWYAIPGYVIGLVVALAVGIVTHSPQPALLFLVPSTLGPIVFISWVKKELIQLWEGNGSNLNDKIRELEV